MNETRLKIWGDIDPYAKTPYLPCDIQGWRDDQPILYKHTDKAELVAEVGVWKGFTSIQMVQRGCAHVLAIDHFRGSAEHFLNPGHRANLAHLYDLFRSNVTHAGLRQAITPLPLDSVSAVQVCHNLGLRFDVVHIDAAHDFESVYRDLTYWAALTDKLVVDDYHKHWSGVVKAVDKFAGLNHCVVESEKGKALITKE